MEFWTVNPEPAGPIRLGFEDSFVNNQQTDQEVTFEKLPDSATYLRRLEEKLGRLEVKRKPVGSVGKIVTEEKLLVESLSRAKKIALDNLVFDDVGNTGSVDLDIEQIIPTNYLARRLVPQQPLNQGEIVELTKTDLLEQEQEKLDQAPNSQ